MFKKNLLFNRFNYSNNNNNNQNNNINNNLNNNPNVKPTEQALNKINENIGQLANKYENNNSPNIQGLKYGGRINPNKYGKGTEKRGRLNRKNTRSFGFMMDPTLIYKNCIYSDRNVSYNQICSSSGSNSFDPSMITNCNLSFCNVCCDNIEKMLNKQISDTTIGANLYSLQSEGYHEVKDAVSKGDMVKHCKKECFKAYPGSIPSPTTKPSRDHNLGSKENPAVDCMDIKTWGPEGASSGNYYIKTSNQNSVEVYCDMDTDDGGWTLFLNYYKGFNDNPRLDPTRFPKNLKDASHIKLNSIKTERKQVKEIRFFCFEESQKQESRLIHFKTNNQNVIDTAFDWDQTHLKNSSWKDGYIYLKKPENIEEMGNPNKFVEFFNNNNKSTIDFSGSSSKGGLTNTPFGSTINNGFWTIVGDSDNDYIYECGTFHRGSNPDLPPQSTNYETSNNKDPNDAYNPKTLHSIFFRGEPLSNEDVLDRLANKIDNDINKIRYNSNNKEYNNDLNKYYQKNSLDKNQNNNDIID